MNRWLKIAVTAALVAVAWSAVALALYNPELCGPDVDCARDTSRLHPGVALILSAFGAFLTVAGAALARWVRPAYTAGVQFFAALPMSIPLTQTNAPVDIAVWLAPVTAEWLAFAGLLLADRAWRPRAP